ncbi:MAG: 16S rRNA (adenine(1518)-N(6)/adenine(1519)-N(6))-dimethyltransferase RsmA, partial [Deltaproteobacteria bacterium]|nr:16S rRNA (adenine(1518)-N(6)/adenine(1519)-N(6))-dimethyltransferase RsmA [Deltaproteobacteria bacterium]
MEYSTLPEPKKSWGQNYLQNKGVIEKIINSLDLESGDVVVEIGAGRGALTREIAEFKNIEIMAIEPHPESFQYLKEYFADNNQVKLLQKDASKLDFSEFGDNYKVVGNLPYNMSTKILLQLLKTGNGAQIWILMFQLEVGERIASKPGSKKYGSISIMAQLITDINILFRVNPGSFYPVPKVKSAVLKFIPHLERKLAFPHEYEIILKKIFSQRRK